MNELRWMLACTLWLVAGLSAGAEERGTPELITVRLLPDVSEETLRFLAEHVVVEQVRVEQGTSIAEALRERNGHYTEDSLRRLRAANPGLRSTEIARDVELAFPPEPSYQENVKVQVGASSSTWGVTRRDMGVGGPKTLARVKALNPDVELSAVETKTRLVLPYSTRFVTYRLKEESRLVALEVVEELKALEPSAVVHAEVGWPLEVIEPLDAADLASFVGPCSSGAGAADWPYSSSAVLDSLAGTQQRLVTVAIVDSGLGEDEDRLPLWENANETPGNARDDDGNGFEDDVHGADIPEWGWYPLALEEPAKMRDHGSHVAGLAAGGRPMLDSPALREEVERRLELMMLKVVSKKGERPQVDVASVSEAIHYAIEEGASIINLSLSQGSSQAVRQPIRGTKNVLFVVAAGNTGVDVEAEGIFPANLGGQDHEARNVITVAAHDSAGTLACFSSYGEQVDIAAPGVALTSTVPGSLAEYSGTSQATGLVSFAAALLMSRGITSAHRTKQVLVLSTDYRPELEGRVACAGLLNLDKALRFEADLVETTDGLLHEGLLRWPSRTLDVGGQEVDTGRIGKLTLIRDVNGTTMRVVARVGKGREQRLRAFWGPLSLKSVTLENADGQTEELLVADIADIINR